MMEMKTRKQTVNWMKAALERQQNWQQEVRQRWAERQQAVGTTRPLHDSFGQYHHRRPRVLCSHHSGEPQSFIDRHHC